MRNYIKGEELKRKRQLMALLPPRLIEYCYNEMLLSHSEIAALVGVGRRTITDFMERNGIKCRGVLEGRAIRAEKDRRKKEAESVKLKATERHGWKNSCGYVFVFAPNHPRAMRGGAVCQHILVAEEMIGRPLKPDEVVHHINGIKSDNRPENLMVMTDHDHRSYHIKETWKRRKAAIAAQHAQEAGQDA